MASAFEVFKIITGVVIGIFFLYFMLNFSGLYSKFQGESIDVTHLSNFKRVLQDVYVSDTEAVFKIRIETLYNPPKIALFTESGSILDIKIPIPFFYKTANKDQDVIAYRSSIDHGFTKFRFVGVFPQSNFFYNIMSYKDESFQLVNDLTNILPQSDDPKIIYGFCFSDDESLAYTKTSFSGLLKSIVKYIESMPNWKREDVVGDRKVEQCAHGIVISQNENFPESGFLIKTAGDIGEVFYKELGQEKVLVYRDVLDILAIITGGEQAYNYKNEEHLKFLEISISSEIERANNLGFEMQISREKCSVLFEDAKNLLTKFKETTEKNLNNLLNAVEYSEAEKEVKDKYKELEIEGCL